MEWLPPCAYKHYMFLWCTSVIFIICIVVKILRLFIFLSIIMKNTSVLDKVVALYLGLILQYVTLYVQEIWEMNNNEIFCQRCIIWMYMYGWSSLSNPIHYPTPLLIMERNCGFYNLTQAYSAFSVQEYNIR